jgi:hypothetical protein
MVDQDPRIERYMQRVRDDHSEFLNQIEAIEVTADLLNDNDDAVPESPFYYRFRELPQDFYEVCGFSIADFDILYQIAEARSISTGRGRRRVLGPRDSFLLFLHWVCTGTSIRTIAAVFGLKGSTPSAKLLQVATCLDSPFGINMIKEASQEPPSASEAFSTYGLVVDATVPERD